MTSTTGHVTDEERRRRIAHRHLLAPARRRDSVSEIADAVVALHSSDPVSVYLGIAARSGRLTLTDIDHALYEARSVVRHHAMRRTLWVTTLEVGECVHAACTRKIASTERSRSAEFVGDAAWFDRAVDQVIALVRSADVPVSTREIGERLPELRRAITYGAGTRHEATGSAHTRAVLVAAFDGAIVRARPAGTWIGSQYAWFDARRWCGIDWSRHSDRAGAVATIRRWLERFGPGTLDDLVWWTGTSKTTVRRALDGLDVTGVDLSSGDGIVLTDDIDPTEPVEPWVAVLPALDSTAMGWKHRSWYLDDETGARVTDRFGNIGPTVWADGRIVGGWAQRPDGGIAVELTCDLSDGHHRMLADEVDRLRAFIGDARFRVRFPSRNQRDLLAGPGGNS